MTPRFPQGYPNQRPVKWIKAVPRTQFTQGALYELGSAIGLFKVTTYAEEYREVLVGGLVEEPAGQDETVGIVAEEIEEEHPGLRFENLGA